LLALTGGFALATVTFEGSSADPSGDSPAIGVPASDFKQLIINYSVTRPC
jgi:hypothetical protein